MVEAPRLKMLLFHYRIRSMPSGLRVTRIDRAPAGGVLELCVNGKPIGGLTNRTMVELTVGPGEVLLEVMGLRGNPLVQVLHVAPGCTARAQIGRRCSLGIVEASHYLQVEPTAWGLPDRTLYPLNLSAHTALEWLQQKRTLGEALSDAQMTFLRSHWRQPQPTQLQPNPSVPSLAELGAFAALGLDSDADEADVREAFRLLISIHTPENGQSNEVILRLEEAYRIAMDVLAKRVIPGVSEVGR